MPYKETTAFGKRNTERPLYSNPMIQNMILPRVGCFACFAYVSASLALLCFALLALLTLLALLYAWLQAVFFLDVKLSASGAKGAPGFNVPDVKLRWPSWCEAVLALLSCCFRCWRCLVCLLCLRCSRCCLLALLALPALLASLCMCCLRCCMHGFKHCSFLM